METRMDIIEQIENIFDRYGHLPTETDDGLVVTARGHALQCAQLAEWADADAPLVAAALLHDIGHLVVPLPSADLADDVHELRAVGLLTTGFPSTVVEPIRLHVQAKRFLVTMDAAYANKLSPASRHSLAAQGGVMSSDELRLFSTLPFSTQALSLRRWDDQANQAGRRTPPLRYYLDQLEAVQRQPAQPLRLMIGALDVA
jgi:predicted HD phosphohydrolase